MGVVYTKAKSAPQLQNDLPILVNAVARVYDAIFLRKFNNHLEQDDANHCHA